MCRGVLKRQECIPVGCVSSAAVTVSRGRGVPGLGGAPGPGGYLVWGMHLVLGVHLVPAVYLAPGGVHGPGEVSALGGYLVPGVSAPGGCTWSRGGVPALGEVYLVRYPPRGQTDACKNITFATSLRTVKMGTYLILVQKTIRPFLMKYGGLPPCMNFVLACLFSDITFFGGGAGLNVVYHRYFYMELAMTSSEGTKKMLQ